MMTEQQTLNLIKKLTPHSRKYLNDDVAIIENGLIVTTDSLIENTHFTLKHYKPEEIGWKAIAVNLSDIASMGAKPLYALISLSLPKKTTEAWFKSLYKSLIHYCKKYRVQVIGGNIARSKEINITVTLIGKTISTNNGLRSNAKPGDIVFTTGTLGDSACGYLLLGSGFKVQGSRFKVQSSKLRVQGSKLIQQHKQPIPQVKLGQDIVRLTKRVSLMDASDGLADCLIQIAKESKVKIIINQKDIPLSSKLLKACKLIKVNPHKLALYGGEDYQLVGTASKKDIEKLKKLKQVKIVGEVLHGKGAFLKQSKGKVVKLDMEKSFRHF